MFDIVLRGALSLEQAEHAVGAALSSSARGERVHLDLSGLRSFQPGAASRIGNAIREVARRSALTATMPHDRRGLSALLAAGIGPQFAAHASTLRTTAGPRTKELRKELASVPALPTTDLLVTTLPRHPAFVSRKRAAVRSLVDEWLSNFPTARGRLPETRERNSIVELIVEAGSNVLDHSSKRPWSGEPVHSLLRLQWRYREELQLLPEGFTGEDESTRYLGALVDGLPEVGALTGLLEISVVDDGVGIAARQALDADIVKDPSTATERRAFADALVAGGTVKLRALDCPVEMEPGFGSEWILHSIRSMYGYASIRSGRVSVSFNALLEGDGGTGFALDPVDRSWVGGTILTVLLPVFERPRPVAEVAPASDRLF